MVDMHILKICFWDKKEYLRLIGIIEAKKIYCHRHIIQNDSIWLKNQNNMPWKFIVDLFFYKDDINRFLELSETSYLLNNSRVDLYVLSQITYGTPVNDGAELITSCYMWNYKNVPQTRHTAMLRHFELEKTQKNYDYVSFQIVEQRIKGCSKQYDFFFEAHVSNPDGIDEIYSKPFISAMRKDTEKFLDVTTRKLSFGRVYIDEF